MAIEDIPAVITKVLETTGKPKVTVIGYSMGSAQMFYSLAKLQDFHADRINRFIAIGPCVFFQGQSNVLKLSHDNSYE